MQDEFKKCKTSLKVSVLQVKTEISSSRFKTVELNSIFGFSLLIQTSLTNELKTEESKLVCLKLPFFYCRV